MTVVCAIKDPVRERVIITSDTGASYHGIVMTAGSKWHLFDGWAFGFAGDMRAQNIAAARLKDVIQGIPGPYNFVQAWYALLKEHDFDLKPAEREAVPNGCQDGVLVTCEQIWSIPSDFSFSEIPGHFWAEGAGKPFALGAAHVLGDLALEPDEIINRATEAAIRIDKNCHAPIWIGQVK